MTFDEAKTVAIVLHYIIALTVAAAFILYKPAPIRVILRTYIAGAFWVVMTYLSDGCPITHLENKIAVAIYGKPFYEYYGFEDTDVHFLFFDNIDLLFPLLFIPVYFMVNRRRQKANRYVQ